MLLLSKFYECISTQSLKHYFIPSFNLLSVKMTDQAQTELLRIFDIMMQSDISIMKECESLNKVWVASLNHEPDKTDVAELVKKKLLRNDE